MDTASLLAAACPTINVLGAAYYFSPETVATGKSHGLDGFRFYMLGRGGMLGDVDPLVVSSAFGWWNPELIDKIWTSARATMAPKEAARLYLGRAAEMGRAKLANVAELDTWCALAEKVVANIDFAGMSLAAGAAAAPMPDDAPGKVMHLLTVLREYRGDAHLTAVISQGLSPKLAHAIKRPDMVKSFGWGEDVPATTAEQSAQLDRAEAVTNTIVATGYGALDSTEAATFVRILSAIEAGLK